QAWMESSSDSDQEINANMVFMAQIEKVLSDSEASSSSAQKRFLSSYFMHVVLIRGVDVYSDFPTIVATSTTEAEYVAAASGCGQVLWIQNQLLDYG
nr:putative ribonuclease H-like domain-containing protein [Tanacetum cinerariifolium]